MTITKNNLKLLRILRGLRQKDVAKLLGCKSEDRVCHWEKGQAMPNVENLFKLCQIYQVTPFEIYEMTQIDQPKN